MAHVAFWDWLYRHHVVLAAGITVFGGLAVLAVVSGARGRSVRLGLLLALFPTGVVIVIVAAWVGADHRSNERDIADRVERIATAVPQPSRQTGSTAGDNFRTRTYVVAHNRADTVAAMASALGSNPGVSRGHGNESSFYASYDGRFGCDGLIEVSVDTEAIDQSHTQVVVSGNCED
jgi:hypothetical protein